MAVSMAVQKAEKMAEKMAALKGDEMVEWMVVSLVV